MRYRLIVGLSLLATPCVAHPGHLADLAGHGHWGAAVAAGAAIAIAIWAGLKGKKSSGEPPVTSPETSEEAEAA